MARYAGEENSLLGNMDVSNAGYKGPKKKIGFSEEGNDFNIFVRPQVKKQVTKAAGYPCKVTFRLTL